MRRRPHGEALRDLIEPARPAAIAAGAVEDQQRIALSADPGVYADAADQDRLLTGSHAPYYAPAAVRAAGRRGAGVPAGRGARRSTYGTDAAGRSSRRICRGAPLRGASGRRR